MLVVVIPLALVAAFVYALSDFIEQRAASRAAHGQGSTHDGNGSRRSQVVAGLGSIRSVMLRLVRDRIWLLGWAVGTLAYFVQAAALHLGSVSVVQSLQVCTLLFALPLSTIGHPERPRAVDWLAGTALCAGLALFLASRGAASGGVHADRSRVILLLALIGATTVVLVLLATLSDGPARATLLALAAGAGFAASATLVKLTTTDLTTVGVGGTAVDWPGYALAFVTATGLVLQQAAFAAGRLATATTAMLVTNPLVGTVIAAIGFHEALPLHGTRFAGLLAGGVLITLGVTGLARSPLLRRHEDEPVRTAVQSRPDSTPSPERTVEQLP